MTLRSVRPWGLLPLVALLVAIPARAETVQDGALRVKVVGGISPKVLPRTGTAPVSVTVAGQITTTDGSPPPQLQALRIEVNRHGRLDYKGLVDCKYSKIQPGSSERALSACRSSLVGKGSFTADITLAGQEPYPTKGKLLVFNSVRKGKPVLYGHIYAPHPFATSFVIVFKLSQKPSGIYGTVLNAPLPRAMKAWGRLTGLTMTLSRRYRAGGKSHSFISSGCPAPAGFPRAVFTLARTTFSFVGGRSLRADLVRSCKATSSR